MTADMSDKANPKKTYRWESMPKMLTFTMHEFKTSKSFSNVYGHHVDELKERLDLFLNHPEWYMEHGIPHTLGIMLHGVPGAGKTSTIKALIKDSHRHPFNIRLREFTTQRQLMNLFFNETVVVQGADGNKQTLKIPLNRRIYILEDIDCLTDVVLDRELREAEKQTEKQTEKDSSKEDKGGDAITLSFLLNLIDGVL
jgi:chaperone BCS1